MIIAHRGESFLAPENSLSAINLAWEKGAIAVEIDIHLTADGEIVVIHDNHTGRVGDRKYIIAKSTLQELKGVDIGRKKAPAYSGERIPTLKDVLMTIPATGKLIVEIKCGREVILPLTEILKIPGLKNHQIEIISFDHETLSLAKKSMPQHKMLWLLDLDYYWPSWLIRKDTQKIIRELKAMNLDGVDVWAGKILNREFVRVFKEEGLPVYAWTVNDAAEAKELLGFGVDAITTDRAEWLTQQVGKEGL